MKATPRQGDEAWLLFGNPILEARSSNPKARVCVDIRVCRYVYTYIVYIYIHMYIYIYTIYMYIIYIYIYILYVYVYMCNSTNMGLIKKYLHGFYTT